MPLIAEWYSDGEFLFECDLHQPGALAEAMLTAKAREGHVGVYVRGLGVMGAIPSPTLRGLGLTGHDFWRLPLKDSGRATILAGTFTLRAGGRDLFMIAVVVENGPRLVLDLGDSLAKCRGRWVAASAGA